MTHRNQDPVLNGTYERMGERVPDDVLRAAQAELATWKRRYEEVIAETLRREHGELAMEYTPQGVGTTEEAQSQLKDADVIFL